MRTDAERAASEAQRNKKKGRIEEAFMKKYHLPHVGKTIGCIVLAGCLLCASTVPAYAAASLHGMDAVVRTVRAAGPGEYLYTQLNDNEKAVYDAIVDQIEELTRNDTDPSGVQVTIPKDSGYSISGKPVFAVFRDHPEFFWVDSSKLVWAEGNPSIDCLLYTSRCV